MDLNCTEIKTEIWINFSSLIRSDSVLPQPIYSAMVLLSGWGLEIFERPLYVHIEASRSINILKWILPKKAEFKVESFFKEVYSNRFFHVPEDG